MSSKASSNGHAAWVGGLPPHWRAQKLKSFADVRFSNVDKHTNDHEQPVRLCNYTDVYYQSEITDQLDFMEATATPEEVAKFKLLAGDILITKDSEIATDIAVPAFVPTELPGVICGYHLAQVRPRSTDVNGKFLYYAFSSHGIRDQFHVAANGITRYGLSQHHIKSALFPLPPRSEQDAIVGFLDRRLADIDRFVANKRRMIDLLEEQKRSVAEQVVLGALVTGNRQSIPELQGNVDIPEQWKCLRARYILREVDDRSVDGSETHLSMVQGRGLVPANEVESWRMHSESYAGGKLCRAGDLVLNRLKAHLSVFYAATQPGVISPDYSVFRMLHRNEARYFELLFRTRPYNDWFCRNVRGIMEGFWRLYTPDLYRLRCVVPPAGEQRVLLSKYDHAVRSISHTQSRVAGEIDLMNEFRASLIAEAVTGKIGILGNA